MKYSEHLEISNCIDFMAYVYRKPPTINSTCHCQHLATELWMHTFMININAHFIAGKKLPFARKFNYHCISCSSFVSSKTNGMYRFGCKNMIIIQFKAIFNLPWQCLTIYFVLLKCFHILRQLNTFCQPIGCLFYCPIVNLATEIKWIKECA